MYLSLNSNTPIIGIDFSYSDDQNKKLSLYFRSKHSMIVDPSFLELLSLMNGLFSRKDITSYAKTILSYDELQIEGILDEMQSWGVIEEKKQIALWGTQFDNEFVSDRFNTYDVHFLSSTPDLIDLSILLCKYCFRSISFSDPDVTIDNETINSSTLLQPSDLGISPNRIIGRHRIQEIKTRSNNEDIVSKNTIYICDGDAYLYTDEYYPLIDATYYRRKMKLCDGLAFDLPSNSIQGDLTHTNFEYVQQMLSDIILGVIDGF